MLLESIAERDASWERKLRLLTVSDRPDLPGACALVDSAFDKGSAGKVDVFVTSEEATTAAIPAEGVADPQLPPTSPAPAGLPISFGWAGVTIDFFLSGFCIHQRRERSARVSEARLLANPS